MLVGRTQCEPWVKKMLNRQRQRWLLQCEGESSCAQVRAIRDWLAWAIESTLLYLRSVGGARLEGQVLVVIRDGAGAIILAAISRMWWEKIYPPPCSWSTCEPH